MQTPVEIDYQGTSPGLTLQGFIEEHVARLEKRYGRITACRVVLKGPGEHHRSGGLYEVHIHLTLPTAPTVNIVRTPKADERRADVRFAISDAFKRARRRLQDRVRRMQGKVKTHEGLPIATVARIAPSGDHGFLETADGREVYFHRNSLLNLPMTALEPGARVTFVEEMGEKGPQASTVKPLGKHGMR